MCRQISEFQFRVLSVWPAERLASGKGQGGVEVEQVLVRKFLTCLRSEMAPLGNAEHVIKSESLRVRLEDSVTIDHLGWSALLGELDTLHKPNPVQLTGRVIHVPPH